MTRSRPLADRGVQAGLVFTAIAAAGMAGIGLSWAGVAATLGVYTQMPFVVSGAIGGVALAGAFLGLLAIHSERRANAVDRLWLETAIDTASQLAETLPPALTARMARSAPSAPAQVRNGNTVHQPDCRFADGRHLPPVRRWTPDLRACKLCRPSSF